MARRDRKKGGFGRLCSFENSSHLKRYSWTYDPPRVGGIAGNGWFSIFVVIIIIRQPADLKGREITKSGKDDGLYVFCSTSLAFNHEEKAVGSNDK
ncbi:hypothetical protein [Phytobacter sp. SCO41]|uniref:hypothetical protein n=1 Tax=Phytobacter sp. SCO41 TaxID=1756993 RepID=UPI0012D80617|nr:hypothetical protein [Phytobacter sp. SCO41]